jgi:hypothetical protein
MPPALANLATPSSYAKALAFAALPLSNLVPRSRMPDYPLTMPGIERKFHVIGVQEISSLYLPHDLLCPCIPACILQEEGT